MARSKEGKPREYHLGELRKLKAENRALKKRLKQLEKHQHQYETHTDPDPEVSTETELTTNTHKSCPDCGKSKLIEFSILDKVFLICNLCGHREKGN